MAELLQVTTWTGWVIRAIPMIQTLFPNNDAVFQDDNTPIHKPKLFSDGLKNMKVNFNILTGQHNHQI
jgi:hypothetical protein